MTSPQRMHFKRDIVRSEHYIVTNEHLIVENVLSGEFILQKRGYVTISHSPFLGERLLSWNI